MLRSCCIVLLCSSLAAYADVTSDELSNVGPPVASDRAVQPVPESAVPVAGTPGMLQGPAPTGGGERGCLPCPTNACWGQQVADPNEVWTAYTSAANLGYLVVENYSAPNCSQICDIHWWGLSLLYDPAYGWLPCDPTGMQFVITFYTGPGPTNPVCTYTVTPTITALPFTYLGFTLYYFSVPQLTPCCSLTSGWVSIQSIATAPGTCSFLWMSACPGQGDGSAIQVQPDGTWVDTGYDFGLCLTPEGGCVNCQAGSIPEGEPPCYDGYIDNYNGGCNSNPPIFQPINCGDAICGTAGTYLVDTLTYRDTDWYELNLTQPTNVTWKAVAEFPVTVAIVDGNNGCNYTIVAFASGDPCVPLSVTAPCLPPGRFWLVILPSVFTGVPCGSTYVAQASCTRCNTGDPNLGTFGGWMENGTLTPGGINDGWTSPEFGGPWFQYPQWWNQWWPNEFDPFRPKHIHLEFDVLTWNNGSVTVAVNWSSPQWTDPTRPPLPPEDQFVVRQVVGTFDVDGHYVVDLTIPFCPPWISIDVWGDRFWIEGTIRHECCVVNCQAGSIPEGEPVCFDGYVDNYNGGCNSAPPVFQPIQCGDAICGTAGTYLYGTLQYRDTDWYQLNLNQPTNVTWKAIGEFPVRLFIIDGNAGCSGYTILATTAGDPCTPLSLTALCLPPGIYWLWIGPNVFTGVPCGSQYVAQVSCTPCDTANPNLGHFSGWMDSDGNFVPGDNNDGWTDPDFGGPWFEYPQWWNTWWPNEFNLQRVKTIVLGFDVLTWNNGWVTVAVNWSSREWTNPQRPPLPWEDQFVVRQTLGTFEVDGHHVLTATIPFCPAWVSVDVWGQRFWLEGAIEHICHPTICVGDLNCDGFIDFGDINPFVLYLSNFAAWQAAFPGCNPQNGDINGDGTYGQGSFGDINPFVALMSTGQGPCP